MFQFPVPPIGPGFDFGPPGGQGPGFGPPSGPPPGAAPPPAGVPGGAPGAAGAPGIGVQAVDPRAIRRCLFRFVYLRLRGRREFWAYLTFVGRRSIAGWRWTGFRWVYFGADLRQIVDFECY